MSKLNYSYIGIGSNLGDRLKNIELAYSLIQSSIGDIIKKSDLYQTPPWGFESNDDFYNSMILVHTKLDSMELLHEIKIIEKTVGRKSSFKIGYSSRLIDLDIIDFNGDIIETEHLSIPHSHLHKRNFVLYPLFDISKDWIHPKLNKSISYLMTNLNQNDKINKVII